MYLRAYNALTIGQHCFLSLLLPQILLAFTVHFRFLVFLLTLSYGQCFYSKLHSFTISVETNLSRCAVLNSACSEKCFFFHQVNIQKEFDMCWKINFIVKVMKD